MTAVQDALHQSVFHPVVPARLLGTGATPRASGAVCNLIESVKERRTKSYFRKEMCLKYVKFCFFASKARLWCPKMLICYKLDPVLEIISFDQR